MECIGDAVKAPAATSVPSSRSMGAILGFAEVVGTASVAQAGCPPVFLAGRRTTHGTCGAVQSPQRRGTWHTLARGDECARAIHHQCGVAQLAARRAHNPEVVRSSRTAATKQRESSTEGSAVDGMPAAAMRDSGRHERQAAARLRLGDKGTCAMPLVLRIARIKPGLSHPRTSVAISAYCAAMHRRQRALEWA